MPHMVIFRDAEGRPGYHQAEGLEDAVHFVEHLRNEREVSDTRVFSMQEVPLEFKSYWRVEVGAGASAAAPGLSVVADERENRVDEVDEAEVASASTPEPEVAAGEPEPVGAGPSPASRFGLFGRN